MRVKTKRGQTWSFDLIVAVVIFIVVVGIFYSLLNRSNEGTVDTQALESGAKSISYQLNCDVSPVFPPCFIENGEINETKLAVVAALPYADLKELLGTTEDFCIYLLDEENRIIPVIDENTPGIGSGSYLLNATLGCDGS
ncbi:MAG: hypothetical protein KC535_00995 [Nanoarchaeota archaeon]|nr:hypothetical protein [Nanoarchaeota archaeon]